MKPKYTASKTDWNAPNQIAPDEPCFVIRATDVLAPWIVEHYAVLAMSHKLPQEFIDDILAHRDRIISWQNSHTDKIKYPD